jgi:RimJ/RimL family protein N-acetyltransferase
MPVLHTSRHHLRPLRADDLVEFHGIWGDPEVIWWGASADEAESSDRLTGFLQRTVGRLCLGWWLVIDQATDEVLGDVALDPSPLPGGEVEIGWHFKRSAWGRGHATEAATALMAHAFSTGAIDELVSTIVPMNTRSVALAERLGMTRRSGTFLRGGLHHGVWEISRSGTHPTRSPSR